MQPSANSFSNKTSQVIEFELKSNGYTLQNAFMEIYDSETCEDRKKVRTIKLEQPGQKGQQVVSGLSDAKYYSVKIFLQQDKTLVASPCSPWIGIDTVPPDPVSLQYPPADGYAADRKFSAAWSATTERSISGLPAKPYLIRLYGQAECAGSVVQEAVSASQQYVFENLTHGVTYSVKVSAQDRAGNESFVSCSPFTEIDVYAPGFVITDPTSSKGYTRVATPDVEMINDNLAGFWCITEDVNFLPTSNTDACPGGSGASLGWYNSRPTNFPVTTGPGLKTYSLWTVRSNGTLISNKRVTAMINYDPVPPGLFSVVGVGGTGDSFFDNWLSSQDLKLKWTASSTAETYSVRVASGGNFVCGVDGVPSSTTELLISSCPPFVNGQTYEVKVIAYDAALNETPANPFPFSVDQTAPSVFQILGVNGFPDDIVDDYMGTAMPNINFENSTGATEYRVKVTDESDTVVHCSEQTTPAPTMNFNYAMAGPTCLTLTDGARVHVHVKAVDSAQNETVATNSPFLVTVDRTNPVLTLTSTPTGPTVQTNATFTFTATDSGSGIFSTQCSLDGVVFSNCTSPVNLSSLPEGERVMQIRAIDYVGNQHLLEHRWIVDTTNPVLTLLSVPPAVGNSALATTTFSATDSSGIQRFECRLDAGSFAICTSPFAPTVAEGNHTIFVRAYDQAGLFDEKSTSFLADLTVPTLNLTSTPSVITASNSATFVFNGADTGGSGFANFQCALDGGAFTTCVSPRNFTGLSEANHTFQVRPTDNAGNVGATASYSWDVYSSGPTVNFTSTPAALNNLSSVTFQFTASVPSGVTVTGYECSLDGAAFTSCTSPRNLTGLTAMSHQFRVRATDSLGTTGAIATYNWVTDMSAPVVTITSGPSGWVNSTSATFTWNISDSGGSTVALVECSVDAGAYSTCASPLNLSSLSPGPHSISVRAADSVGNVGGATTRNWSIDLVNPVLSSVSGPSSPQEGVTSGSITFSSSDASSGLASTQCQLNGGSWTACASGQSYSGLSGGMQTVIVRLTDQAGNITTGSYSWQVNTYSWQASGWGACSASPYWSYGSWSSCSNTSCWSAEQTRSASCVDTSGTQTQSVWCQRHDGATVASGFCTGGAPATSQGCSTWCSGSPTTSQSCTAGTACRYAIIGIQANYGCFSAGFYSGPDAHGSSCGSVGSQTTYVYTNGNQGICGPGNAYADKNDYSCTFCASGNWYNCGPTICCSP